MPHVNELAQKFGDRGLSVLGVTEESQGLTEPWVAEHGVRFAYAYDKSGRTEYLLGGDGLPAAALIDPQGRLAWKGHPAQLTEQTIERVLKGAPLAVPLFALEGYTAQVRSALFEERYADMYAGLERVEGGTARDELRQALELVIDRRLRRVEDWFEVDGDYLAVQERCDLWSGAFRKLPQEPRVQALVKRLKGRDVRKVLRAQEKVRDLVPEGARIDHDDREKIAKDLRKIIADLPGTAAARDAQEALDYIGA